MATGAQIREWSGPSRRRVPRFQVQAPLDVTVMRSGVPDTVPGRSVNVCERGMSAVLAGELVPGEAVGIEVQLPLVAQTLCARALVRYQDKLRCGLEFIGLSAEQRSVIRDWTKEAKAETEMVASSIPVTAKPSTDAASVESSNGGGPRNRKQKRRGGTSALFLIFLFFAVVG